MQFWLMIICLLMAQPVFAQELDLASPEKIIPETLYEFEPIPADELQSQINYALNSNDAETQYRLGRMYEDGINVNINYRIAIEWYEVAANNGFVPAMVDLARIYLFGLDTIPAVPRRAFEWLMEAEKSDEPLVDYEIAIFYETVMGKQHSYKKALDYYKRAARGGVLNALGKLAIFYQYGLGMDEPNIRVALKYYNMLEAKANNQTVTDYVRTQRGEIYEEIAMAQETYENRFKWIAFAAKEGRVSAMQHLATLYLNGQGVQQDYLKAAGWFAQAAKFDDTFSMTQLGYLYLNGYGVKRDYKKALEWFTKAAELGNAEAAWNIGNIYYYGYGVDVDRAMANIWFTRADNLGNKEKKNNTRKRRGR